MGKKTPIVMRYVQLHGPQISTKTPNIKNAISPTSAASPIRGDSRVPYEQREIKLKPKRAKRVSYEAIAESLTNKVSIPRPKGVSRERSEYPANKVSIKEPYSTTSYTPYAESHTPRTAQYADLNTVYRVIENHYRAKIPPNTPSKFCSHQ